MIEYLNSIGHLLIIADDVRQKRNRLINYMSENGDVILKSLIAAVDLQFMYPYPNDPSRETSEVLFYSIEELCEGLSYLVYLFHQNIGIKDHHFNWLDEEGVKSSKYSWLLINACMIRHFMETELLVDSVWL